MANTSYNTVTVSTTATQILGASSNRKGLLITNEGNIKVFVGPDASITASNAVSIPPDGSLSLSGFDEAWRGDVYGICASDTVDVRYWEWGR